MAHKARMTAEIPSVMSYLQNAHAFFKVVIHIFFYFVCYFYDY